MKNIVLLLTISIIVQSTIVIPPIKKNSIENDQVYALIWLQGAECEASSYASILREVQNQFAHTLWLAVPEFPLNKPVDSLVQSKIQEAIQQLKDQGLPDGAGIFYGGHSLGSFLIQDYIKNNTIDTKGVILHGGFIQRKYLTVQPDGSDLINFSVPVATIGGELDGLVRVSRLAEAYYKQIMNSNQGEYFPVTVVKGVSHVQFFEGFIPTAIKNRDLQPEIKLKDAHFNIAKNTVAFMHQILGVQFHQIDQYTVEFLKPMVNALILEGYNNFKPPCYKSPLVNSPDPTCMHGSPWAEFAQASLGGLEGTPTSVKTDANFHLVADTNPIHLPEIENDCDGKSVCEMRTISVVEAKYDSEVDRGYEMITASELKTKLVSRQNIWHHNGIVADFSVTDSASLCGEANQKSIDWALQNLPKDTVARYQSYGQKLRIGEDLGPYNAGPLWIWTLMSYTEEIDSNQKSVITVQAPMMKTAINYLIKSAAGFHYCKLLSPAYVSEWIYVDGLFKYRSLKDVIE